MTPVRHFLIIGLLTIYSAGHSQSFTFVFLNSRKDKAELPKEELDMLMDGHMKNIERLANEKKLIVAGPFEGGGGIFIMNTPSVDQANEWLQSDPGIKANRWKVEVLPYLPRVGSACEVTEPYEMITYTLIRFTPNIHKDNVRAYDELKQRHDVYLKQLTSTGNVITEGEFGSREGGILVMRGDINQAICENDPAVKGGTLLFDIRKLWVAKGAFCEK